VLVEVDLLGELLYFVDILLPNRNTLHQKVIYETLPKFCSHCHVLIHSSRVCSKATNVNKELSNQDKEHAMNANMSDVSVGQVRQMTHLLHINRKKHAHKEHRFDPMQVEVGVNKDGWETVGARKNLNKQHQQRTTMLVTGKSSASYKVKEVATSIDMGYNKFSNRNNMSRCTRSSAKRHVNIPSGSGGEPPTTFPIPC
jgi:hypothetical protein